MDDHEEMRLIFVTTERLTLSTELADRDASETVDEAAEVALPTALLADPEAELGFSVDMTVLPALSVVVRITPPTPPTELPGIVVTTTLPALFVLVTI